MSQKCGTWSEPSEPRQFWCSSCKAVKVTFKEQWYKGWHAGGDEDQQRYLCPDCGDILDTESV